MPVVSERLRKLKDNLRVKRKVPYDAHVLMSAMIGHWLEVTDKGRLVVEICGDQDEAIILLREMIYRGHAVAHYTPPEDVPPELGPDRFGFELQITPEGKAYLLRSILGASADAH